MRYRAWRLDTDLVTQRSSPQRLDMIASEVGQSLAGWEVTARKSCIHCCGTSRNMVVDFEIRDKGAAVHIPNAPLKKKIVKRELLLLIVAPSQSYLPISHPVPA